MIYTFLRFNKASEILAYYIYDDLEHKEQIKIEYFTKETLCKNNNYWKIIFFLKEKFLLNIENT